MSAWQPLHDPEGAPFQHTLEAYIPQGEHGCQVPTYNTRVP
jgi:hypothetical protein